jgi:hypothetical protein
MKIKYKSKDIQNHLWNSFKYSNLDVLGVPEMERDKRIFLKEEENSQNLMKSMNTQIQII